MQPAKEGVFDILERSTGDLGPPFLYRGTMWTPFRASKIGDIKFKFCPYTTFKSILLPS